MTDEPQAEYLHDNPDALIKQAAFNMLIEEVHNLNVKHGWFDDHRSFAADIALLHSEVSEMFEAYRRSEIQSLHYGPDLAGYNPHAMTAEAADLLIRLIDTCFRYNIDIFAEYEKKMEYNRQRPYRHGNKQV